MSERKAKAGTIRTDRRRVGGSARRTQERGRTRRAILVEASRKLLREREIDQEVDFRIVRESRQKLMEGPASAGNGSRRRFFRKS